jgi:hypothetical protein
MAKYQLFHMIQECKKFSIYLFFFQLEECILKDWAKLIIFAPFFSDFILRCVMKKWTSD